LDLGQTTSPLNHSHFAHIHSASLNAAQEKGALLRRIRWTDDNGNLWLFGGASNSGAYVNDLWRYQP
jgi:hypothetical protein